MDFIPIKNKLQKYSLKKYNHFELKVNDMHIIANKKDGMWKVKILHEEKDTKTDKYLSEKDLIDYINAYILTARTKIKILKEVIK